MGRRLATAPEGYNTGEAILRGQQAEAVMASPIFREAIERAAERFYEQWLAADELNDREALWAKSHALSAVEDELRDMIANGQVAASQVEE